MHVELVRGLKAGSHKDFNRLYELYADLLYGFVFNLTHSPSDAKDILQETFLRVWQSREQLSTEMSFKSYLYTIAHHLIIDSFRSKVQSVAFEEYIRSDAYQAFAENSVEQQVHFDEFCRRLEEAKGKLTERQRIVFELSREKGQSISAIAQQLDISEKTVKNQLTLSVKILRTALSQYHTFLFLFL